MIHEIQQFAQHAVAFEITQADALVNLLGGGAAGLVKAILLAPLASMAVMVLGTLARLRK
jgi:hypothetical protein